MNIEIDRKDTAIRNLYPNVGVIRQGNWSCFDTDGNAVEYDEDLVEAEITRLESEYDAQEYARNRRNEYPYWDAQLNKIYDDGLTKWKSEMVDPVKTKWPKDNSGPVE